MRLLHPCWHHYSPSDKILVPRSEWVHDGEMVCRITNCLIWRMCDRLRMKIKSLYGHGSTQYYTILTSKNGKDSLYLTTNSWCRIHHSMVIRYYSIASWASQYCLSNPKQNHQLTIIQYFQKWSMKMLRTFQHLELWMRGYIHNRANEVHAHRQISNRME